MGSPTVHALRRAAPATLVVVMAVLGLGLARTLAAGARLSRADVVVNNGAEITTLDPATVSGIPEGRVLNTLYEGLTVKHPSTLEPLPGMAERWEQSPDGLRYTFHLRTDARWNNGDPLTAQDFVWSWLRLLAPETGAPYGYLLWSVVNAEAFARAASDEERTALRSQVGLRAPDAHTLVVELETPVPYFLRLTSFHPLFPVHRGSIERAKREAPERWRTTWVRPERIVTNGPFRIVERRVNDRIRVEKSPTYWDAEHVAMRTIDILAVEHYGTMLNLYLSGEVDWIDRCAPNLIPRMLEREDFRPRPYLGSYFYRVNVRRPPFDDRRVRRALALAIDREAICEKITKKGEEPLWSLCPPGMPGYAPSPMPHADRTPPEGAIPEAATAFERDCEEARALLRAAGFAPETNPFPSFAIHYNTAEVHRDLAEVVADGWRRHLGLDVRLENQEWKVYLETQNAVAFDVSRSSWIGDFPDPSTFLELFLSDGPNNRTGWSDARFDERLDQAARELDPERRMTLLAEAEALLMEELPILPIYAYVSQNAVNPRLGGFHANVQDEHPPKFWYWRSDEELARLREGRGEGAGSVVSSPGPRAGLHAPACEGRAAPCCEGHAEAPAVTNGRETAEAAKR